MKSLITPLLICFLALTPLSASTAENNSSQPVEQKDTLVNEPTTHDYLKSNKTNAPTSAKNNLSEKEKYNNRTDTSSPKELLLLIQKQNESIESLIQNQKELQRKVSTATSSGPSFAAWVSILLGCVAILVTVLGVVIALISFFGYKNFKESTKEAAEKISSRTASEVAQLEAKKQINAVAKEELARLIDEGQLSSHLESAVDVIMRRQGATSGVGGFNKYPELDAIGEE